MLREMARTTVTIIGPGSLGTGLATALHATGYAIDEVISRNTPDSRRCARLLARRLGAQPRTFEHASFDAPIVWLCVSDGAIAECARELTTSREWRGKTVFHSSGALTSDELTPLRRVGAHVASLHPMMTFVHGVTPKLAGVTFAFEGDRGARPAAQCIVRDLGGNMIEISKRDKPLYHAWGAFSSPLLIANFAVAERIARKLGLSAEDARRTVAPILRQTIENYLQHGPAAAFSGPIVRGDIATVRKHLEVLRKVPGAREAYIALVRAALKDLPVRKRKEVLKLLDEY
jgi:predicted short-subunit dehydrogenase-like oxidoreductase (DUF2520 family)